MRQNSLKNGQELLRGHPPTPLLEDKVILEGELAALGGALEHRQRSCSGGRPGSYSASCVPSGKLFNLSQPWFPHQFNGDKSMPQGDNGCVILTAPGPVSAQSPPEMRKLSLYCPLRDSQWLGSPCPVPQQHTWASGPHCSSLPRPAFPLLGAPPAPHSLGQRWWSHPPIKASSSFILPLCCPRGPGSASRGEVGTGWQRWNFLKVVGEGEAPIRA